ncbi:MAG: GNAT family N-acetyltransferase [Chloroflexi bacterium]|nr:GNAT family N-acetyltransferase [Chloroflexota bacterium]
MTLLERPVLVAGPRVQVRPFTRADVDAWQAWPDYDDALLAGTSPRRMPPEQRTQWLRELTQRQGQIPFAIDDESGRFIGRLFLRAVRADEGAAVLGIDLDPDVLGRGYGTEALGAFLRHYFGPMGFDRMQLSVAAFNERARRSYASLGFRLVGSHWDTHPGPDVISEPRFRHVAQYFRRGSLGLEALFYDMVLERDAWRALL